MPVRAVLQWFNQKIGNFFGDFKHDRELKEEPGVSRDITRLLCLLCLLGWLRYAFYWIFNDAPNVRVKRVYLDGKDCNVAIERLYSSSASYGTDITQVVSTELKVLDYPCTSTTISWIDYVHFYTINSTFIDPSSGEQLMNYNQTDGSSLIMYSLIDSSSLNRSDFYRDADDLTTDKFCSNIYLWPRAFMNGLFQEVDCKAMVTALLTTTPTAELTATDEGVGSTSWNDPRASYFESPSLQDQKFLYSNTIRRLYAYQQAQYTLLRSQRPEISQDPTHREMFMSGMTDLWLNVLDSFGANSSSTDLDFFIKTGNRSLTRFNEVQRFFPDEFTVVLYSGNTFLGMDINWLQYYNACQPAFCDETMSNTAFSRTYTTLAQVGGLWGVAVVVLTLIVWPPVAFLLVRVFRCCSSRHGLARELTRYKTLQKTNNTNAEISLSSA